MRRTWMWIPGILLGMVLVSQPAIGETAEDLFHKGMHLEEVKGELEKAISAYQELIKNFATEIPIAAQAQLHVGMCYEKLANQEARKAYQTVVDKYPTQQEVVRVARQRLASMNSGHQVGPTVTVREFLHSGETSIDKISDPTIDFIEFVTTRDGQTFVYTDWMTGDLVVKNFSTGKTQALYNVNWEKSEEFFEAPVLSPDGKRVAYVNYSYANGQNVTRIGVDSVQGGNRGVLYENKMELYPHDWSPDGDKILASLEAADHSFSLVTVGTRDKKMLRLVTLNWETPLRAEYSPDGRFIAYDSTKDGDRKIYLLASDGLEERVLVDSPGENDSPLWTRDGRFLLFRSSRSGEWGLFALPMKGGQPAGDPILIKPNIGEATFLRSITDDGKLFYGEETGGQDIAIVERGDKKSITGARILPRIKTRANASPSFAPDGKSLAYITGRHSDRRQMLRIASLEGKVLKEVSLTPEFRPFNTTPAFSPDGSKIALVVHDLKKQFKILVISAESGTILKNFGPLTQQGYIKVSGWSGDGQHLYAWIRNTQETEKASLASINVETEKTVLTPLPKNVSLPGPNPKVSPDGNYLIMTVKTDSAPGQDLKVNFVLRVLSDGTEKVIKRAVNNQLIGWDYDSRHIFYGKKEDEKRVYRCSIETGVEEVFLEDAKDFRISSASSDGKHIAFSKGGYDARIWAVEHFLPKSKTELAAR